MKTTRSTVRSVCPQTGNRRYTSTELALCQSFLLAMSGHAGPIQIDVGVTPVVCRISCGQAAALVNGRRACRADLNVSSRASEGDRSHPEGCDCRCRSERRRGVSGKLRFRRQHWRISCDDLSMLLTAQESRSHRFLFIEVTNTC